MQWGILWDLTYQTSFQSPLHKKSHNSYMGWSRAYNISGVMWISFIFMNVEGVSEKIARIMKWYSISTAMKPHNLWEYDTENHTEKSNHTEKTLKPHWKVLQKIITLKFPL